MVFSSALFLTLFLPTLILVYVLIQEQFRVALLLLASLFFYGWGEPKAVFCMIAMIVVNFLAAILIERNELVLNKLPFLKKWGSRPYILVFNRKYILLFSIAFNLLALFFINI